MPALRVASRYAKSLLQHAIAQNRVDNIHQDMLLLDKVCNSNCAFLLMLKSPVISGDKKLKILKQIFKNKVDELTFDFFSMVAQKNREKVLPTIIKSFLAQYNTYRKITLAYVTTTFQLTDNLRAHFKTIVKEMVSCEEVKLINPINESLLGGYILRVGDKQIDESLRTKLSLLKLVLTKEAYTHHI
ncbi:MAG: ATP synthase F1 subunit delta [Cytophagales bacterium]|nr:ATP synthase F1 subunit delta [Cytophagales bacterium]